MAASAGNIASFALLVSILALQVPSCIDQCRTTTRADTSTTTGVTASLSTSSAPPPLFDDGALEGAMAMLTLAGMDAVLIATAVIYSRHTHHAAVGVGGGNWRVSELVFFILCLQVSVLQFVLFVQEPAAAAGALGTSALPCVASVTFFLGITLICAHVVSNGGGAAVAGNGPAPATTTIVRLLAGTTLGASLVCLMSTVVALFYINTK